MKDVKAEIIKQYRADRTRPLDDYALSQAAYYLSRSFWTLIYIIEKNVVFETGSAESKSKNAAVEWAKQTMAEAVKLGLMPERPLLKDEKLAESTGFLDSIPEGKNHATP